VLSRPLAAAAIYAMRLWTADDDDSVHVATRLWRRRIAATLVFAAAVPIIVALSRV
jgi:hypothetical protein